MLKKKVIITSALVGAFIFIGGKCFASSTGVINTETVNLRAKASTDSNIVTLLSQDDKVEILEDEGEWYKVKAGEKTGYIYAKYVTKKDSTNTEKTDTSDKKEDTSKSSNEETQTNTTEDAKKEESKENSETKPEETKTETQSEELAINSQVKVVTDVEIKIIPLINSNIIGKIASNSTIFILDYINGWYYISSDNIEGWVRKENLNTEKQVAEDQKEEEKTEENKEDKKEEKEESKETETTKYVNVEKVNVRKSASTNSDVLKTISKNTKVTVYSISDGWAKVKVDGTEGYISSEFLSNSKVSEESTTNRSMKESRTEAVSESTNSSEPSASGLSVVNYAKSYLGKPYVSGGAGPNSFDCSGFTQYIYKNYGVSLSHSASAQAYVGTEVDKSNLQAGDIVVFKGETGSGVGHVGIYIGGDQFIHASNPRDGVKITSMSSDYYSKRYVTSRRVLQ